MTLIMISHLKWNHNFLDEVKRDLEYLGVNLYLKVTLQPLVLFEEEIQAII